MQKKLTLIVGLLALLSLPHITNAQNFEYIPSTSFFDSFAKPRTAEKLVAEQQQRSQDRREAEQAAALAAQRGEEETLYGSAPEENLKGSATATTGDSFISPETLSTLRLIERIQQDRQEAELRNKALSILGADLNLHSGAPLQDFTGKGIGKDTGKGVITTVPVQVVPEFLPTQTVVLAPTGASSVSVLVLLALGIIGTGAYLVTMRNTAVIE